MILTIPAIDITISIFLIILSYFIGSIPFGVILGKLICKKDIRQYGSKNIGTTNAVRVLGKKVGFLVFGLDVFKGMAVILLIAFLEFNGIWKNPANIELFIYGGAAIIGHCYSIFLEFKGGKAVATSLGVILVLTPIPAIACLLIFGIILGITGYVSLGSTGATLTVLISTWLLYFIGVPEVTSFTDYLIHQPSLLMCILYSLLAALIIFKHSKNYKRLLNGTENSFKKKK